MNNVYDNMQMEPLQTEANVVNQMYNLIARYDVPTPPEDFVVYQVHTSISLLSPVVAARLCEFLVYAAKQPLCGRDSVEIEGLKIFPFSAV